MRDHGGNLDAAMACFGGDAGTWIDLSTGINPRPYPVPQLSPRAWTALPTRADMAGLCEAAARAFGASAPIVALAGAQGAIQMVPHLRPRGRAKVLTPTYNEHAGSLESAGWQVEPVAALADLAGADIAVVVNPNNPDGRTHAPADLLALAGRVGLLVVDESFGDPMPELSVAASLKGEGGNILVLRSFGKFYGLAGVRLGFAIGAQADIDRLAALAGPWPVSGAAVEIGCRALADTAWQGEAIARMSADAERLDTIAARAGWGLVGGTILFRLYDTGDASAAQEKLARAHVWSRIFPYSQGWMRLGLPDGEDQWTRIAAALS